MDTFIKTTAGILITLLLCLILSKQGKEFSLLLTVAACSMVAIIIVTFLKPVINFIKELEELGQLDNGMVKIILKSVGIGLLTEITGLICVDIGNASLGKVLQILASVVILWMSIPLFENLIELIKEILQSI